VTSARKQCTKKNTEMQTLKYLHDENNKKEKSVQHTRPNIWENLTRNTNVILKGLTARITRVRLDSITVLANLGFQEKV